MSMPAAPDGVVESQTQKGETMERMHGRRLASAAVGAAVVFAAVGGVGLAAVASKPAKTTGTETTTQTGTQTGTQTETSGSAKKVTICHKGKVTLSVSVNAVRAHQRQHHDTIGACPTVGSSNAAKNAKAGKKEQEKEHESD